MSNIINKQNADNYIWGNNCLSYFLCDTEHLSVKLETMPPNTSEQLHFHVKSIQVFFILKGKAIINMDGKVFELKENESITINSLQKHYIKNETQSEIEFLVISQPNTRNDRNNVTDI
jgi:mannose-6-phosphate isomerase-like protein (cupin superfamily)